MNNLSVVVDQCIYDGRNSRVYRAHDASSSNEYIVKEVDRTSNTTNETEILTRLPPHKNLLPILGHVLTNESSFLVQRFLPHPTLELLLKEGGPLSEGAALYILTQLLETIKVLDNYGVAHRDIKPENILVNKANYDIFLIDFGLSSQLQGGGKSSRFVGTPLYMSPEILKQSCEYDMVLADIWSAGAVYLECLYGFSPFHEATSIEHLIHLQHHLPLKHLSRKAFYIATSLLSLNPAKRTLGGSFELSFFPMNDDLSSEGDALSSTNTSMDLEIESSSSSFSL